MPASKFQHNLARFRRHLDLTQSDVAKLVGCSRIAIQAIELGKLPLSEKMAAKLQGALGVPAEWLKANNLKSPIPEPLRAYQDGNVSYKGRVGIVAGGFEHAFSMLEGLKNEREFVLFRHHTDQYINTLSKSFPTDYPARGFPAALRHQRKFIEELEAQTAAELPRQRRRNRQSA